MDIKKARVGMRVRVTKKSEFAIGGGCWIPDGYIIGVGRHCVIVGIRKQKREVVLRLVNHQRGYVHGIGKVCLRGRNHYGADLEYTFPVMDVEPL